MKLKRKISLFFVFALIIPVTGLLFMLLGQNAANIKELNEKEVQKTVALVNTISRQELEKGSVSLDYLRNVFYQEGAYQLNNALYDIRRNSTNFVRVYVLNELNETATVYPKDGEISTKTFNTKWYQKARVSNKLIYSSDKNTSGKYIVTVSKSLVSNGKTIGVVAIDIDLGLVFSELQNTRDKSISQYLIIDSFTNNIIYPEVTTANEELLKELKQETNMGRIMFYKDSSSQYSYYKESVVDTNWILVGMTPLSELKVTYSSSRNILYICIGIAIFVSVFGVIAFDNAMISPLVQVRDKFKQASTGNFGTRIFVDGNDEISDLAQEFNTLMKKINKKVKAVESNNKNIPQPKIETDVFLEEETSSGLEFEKITLHDFKGVANITRKEVSSNKEPVQKIKKFESLEDMVAEDFDNPIVDGDETFQKHQRDLIHRTFDEWRSEYFKTLEDKKVDAKEEEQEKKEEEPKAIASSILDEPEELL